MNLKCKAEDGNKLLRPKYNTTLNLRKKLEDFKSMEPPPISLEEKDIERINEKASAKLNPKGTIYNDLVPVEPDPNDFMKCLVVKHKMPGLHSQPSSKKQSIWSNDHTHSELDWTTESETYSESYYEESCRPQPPHPTYRPHKGIDIDSNRPHNSQIIEHYYKWN